MTAVIGRRRLFLIFCCIALVSAFMIKTSADLAARSPQEQAARAGLAGKTADCGGEPCDAVVRGGLAFLDRRLRWARRQRPRLRRIATCRLTTSSSRRRASKTRFRLLPLLRRFNPLKTADDPLFRAD